MEHFGAAPDGLPPANLIVREVKSAQMYLGIFGVRYGSIDPATGLSMTELEFREAERSGMLMLVYVIHDEASVPVAHLEREAQGITKLAKLKAHIYAKHQAYMFRNVDDLKRQVGDDLEKLKRKKKI